MVKHEFIIVPSLRSWFPDRMVAQARKYISESMGTKYAEGVILDMEKMLEESTIRIPMVCFLSMGSDPTNDIDMLSRKLQISKHCCIKALATYRALNSGYTLDTD